MCEPGAKPEGLTCVLCPAGSSGADGETCTICGAGEVSADPGATECTPCRKGTFQVPKTSHPPVFAQNKTRPAHAQYRTGQTE